MTPSHPHRSPWIAIFALYAAGLGAAGQFAKMAVILPELGRAYPQAGAALGFLISLISLMGVLLGLVAGLLVARIGFRRTLLWALLIGAAISLIETLLPPLPLMLGLRVIEGSTHLALVVAAPTLIAQVAPDRIRPAALTLWGTYFSVAFAATAFLGVPLARSFGPQILFALHAGWMILMALVLLRLLPADRTRPQASPQMALSPAALLRRHLSLYSSAFLSAPAWGWLFYTLTFVAILAVWPPLLPPATGTLTATLAPLAAITASMTLGVTLLRHWPAVRVVMLGFALALGLALILPFAPENPVPVIALFGALGLVQGASFAAIPQLNDTVGDRALANGALAQMGNLGNMLGTPLMLGVLAVGGKPAVIAVLALCYGMALITHLGLDRARRRLQP
ncbi:MFS transporter [Pseudodonghicola flavimaris]|uniref:MFS transporter n=1 Tax=Pseudodonghicola flavimaris TaxID=3050036 RepID=A0ABT7F525_9RHOB|nr:MFS transporter [Pseudodonghicola flavimaris]MDK3019714.1 MFS transporter [Pseudodonghicola flavimaris]